LKILKKRNWIREKLKRRKRHKKEETRFGLIYLALVEKGLEQEVVEAPTENSLRKTNWL